MMMVMSTFMMLDSINLNDQYSTRCMHTALLQCIHHHHHDGSLFLFNVLSWMMMVMSTFMVLDSINFNDQYTEWRGEGKS